ncbi:urease accessory protein UreD [Blastococcus sp. SYSU DS0617]
MTGATALARDAPSRAGSTRPTGRPAVRARLDCTVARDGDGRMRVHGTSSGPVHPVHHPASRGPDVLVLTTDTAGLAAGDALHLRVALAAGADVVVTDPGPTQLLPGDGGSTGRQTTVLEVAAGARLVLLPHALVPLRRSRSQVDTVVRLEPGARAVVGGVIAPGRVSAGEVWVPDRLDCTTDLYLADRLVVRDAQRVEVSPAPREEGHLVSALVSGPPDAGLLPRVRAAAGSCAGVSELEDGLLAVRAIVDTQHAAGALLRAVAEAVRPDLAGWGWSRIGR